MKDLVGQMDGIRMGEKKDRKLRGLLDEVEIIFNSKGDMNGR